MSSSFGYDMGTTQDLSNTMFGTMKKNQQIAASQFDYMKPGEALEKQTREGDMGFGIAGGLLKGIKGTKDVIQKAQDAKTAVTGAITDAQTAGRNVATTVNNAVGQVNKLAGTSIPSIPGAAQGSAAAEGPKFGPQRAPLETNLASTGDKAADKTAIRGASSAQQGAVGDLDTAGQAAVKSQIQNHPIAGRNIGSGSGASTDDAYETMNSRASIINDGNEARYGLGGSTNNLRMGQWGNTTQQMGLNNTGGNAPTSTNAHATPDSSGPSSSSGLGEAGADAADAGEQLAKTGLSTGLEVAGGILDALGPVGDLLGVGMAIFGGIEGAKKQGAEEDAQAATQKVIDAPTQQTVVTGVGKTLDTSQGGSAPSAVHF